MTTLPSSGAPSAPASGASAATVLVVEDNPLVLCLYEEAFSRLDDVRMLVARNGFEGLVAIAQHKPDVVITDLDMPEFDGFRMLDILDNDPASWPDLMLVASGLAAWQIDHAGGLPSRATLIRKKAVSALGVREMVRQFMQDRATGQATAMA